MLILPMGNYTYLLLFLSYFVILVDLIWLVGIKYNRQIFLVKTAGTISQVSF